jgi:hypothetical protein
MASCDEYQAGIVALFDSEAGDAELRLAAGHLQDCPGCRAFFLDLIALRRIVTSAGVPSLSPAAREAVLAGIKADPTTPARSCTKDGSGLPRFGWVGRWAAILLIGLLSIACLALGRTAKDLWARLGAAERQVAAIHERTQMAESQERQQKAISALYFRMAELEDRVSHFSPSQRASVPAQAYERPERQSNL